jgi:hypothetical protein
MLDQILQERRRADHVRDSFARHELEPFSGVPALHQHGAGAEQGGREDGVDHAGDVRQRRRHQRAIARRERMHPLQALHLGNQGVVGMEHPLRIGGGAGRVHEHQQRIGGDGGDDAIGRLRRAFPRRCQERVEGTQRRRRLATHHHPSRSAGGSARKPPISCG